MFDFDPIVDVTEVKDKVPAKAGVYIGYNLTNEDNLRITYVGEAVNLRNRLHRHPKGCTHFSFEVISSGNIHEGSKETRRKKRESELIEKFAPESNINKVDNKRACNEEWVIRYNEDGGRELWKQPRLGLKEGDPGYFEPKKIKELGRA